MDRVLEVVLRSFIQHGTLRLTTAGGTVLEFGDGTGEPVAVRFTTRDGRMGGPARPRTRRRRSLHGRHAGDRAGLDRRLARTRARRRTRAASRRAGRGRNGCCAISARRLQQFNPRTRARRNVAHHYDLDGRLYSLFLDADRQYSCAYFEHPEQSLDDAQLAKKRHLAAKLLRASPTQRVLDIGSGWGGLALYLAEFCGARVTGITLSRGAIRALARRAPRKRASTGAVEFRLQDYRDVAERFDRIVSVGMFEHVGVGYYDTFFRKCAELLADDGVMLLHSIGRSEGPSVTNPWIAKYIFPGGYIPALSEVLPRDRARGIPGHRHRDPAAALRRDAQAWRERFLAHREEVERIYDQRFVRMWEFYLAASEMAFREQDMMVIQFQLTKRQGVVPITRDYIAREEARLRGAGKRQPSAAAARRRIADQHFFRRARTQIRQAQLCKSAL